MCRIIQIGTATTTINLLIMRMRKRWFDYAGDSFVWSGDDSWVGGGGAIILFPGGRPLIRIRRSFWPQPTSHLPQPAHQCNSASLDPVSTGKLHQQHSRGPTSWGDITGEIWIVQNIYWQHLPFTPLHPKHIIVNFKHFATETFPSTLQTVKTVVQLYYSLYSL